MALNKYFFKIKNQKMQKSEEFRVGVSQYFEKT